MKEKNFQNLSLVSKENSSKIPYCPIIAGINFLDQINNLEELGEIKFENLSFPILFIPFVSRASEIIGKRIFLTIDEKEFLLNFNQSIYSNYLSGDILEKSGHIKIKFIENKKSSWRYINYDLSTFFFYKYMANPIKTYNNSQNFSNEVSEYIKNSSPINFQQSIIPNEELERLRNKFLKTKLNNFIINL